MARVVAVFDDLLLGSNVLGMRRAAGHEAQLAGGETADPRGAQVLIVDRGEGALEGTGTIGVYSHVDADTRERAQAAGFDLVVPRSRMAREGAALVERVSG
jgi:hypothetical protein